MSATSLRLWALILALIAVAAESSWATAPNLMTYQGRIKESGLPVTGSRSVEIYLCPDPVIALGSCADTGAQTVQVVNGLFRTTFSIPSGVNWETGEWYLQLQVNGALFSPREVLASGPYAIYASSASTLIPNAGSSGVSIGSDLSVTGTNFNVGSDLVVTGGKVGVGTASPATALEIAGTLTLSAAGHVVASGAGASSPIAGLGCVGSTIAGSDSAGRITLAAGVASDCLIAFGTAWSTNPPACFFNDETRNLSLRAKIVNTTDVTFTAFGGTLTAGDVISYHCVGY